MTMNSGGNKDNPKKTDEEFHFPEGIFMIQKKKKLFFVKAEISALRNPLKF